MPLTDFAIKSAKATHKPRKLADFDGLYLYVTPRGSRLWRMQGNSLNELSDVSAFGTF